MDPSFSLANLIEALVLGVALAMDAMAVTLSNTLCEPDMPRSRKIAMPVAFALFQMGMPIAGYFGGTLVAPLIEAYAGVVSLVILAFVGGKMVWEAAGELREPDACPASRLTWPTIALEAVATSIDAFVVGVSFAASGKDIVLYGGAIGVTTFACCMAVLLIGRRLGEHFGPRAQIAGGIVLIAIGVKAFLGRPRPRAIPAPFRDAIPGRGHFDMLRLRLRPLPPGPAKAAPAGPRSGASVNAISRRLRRSSGPPRATAPSPASASRTRPCGARRSRGPRPRSTGRSPGRGGPPR